jgi:hypothetical protein
MPTDEKPCSVQIGFFGWKASAQVADALAKLFKQPNGAKNMDNEFGRFNLSAHKTTH